MKIYKVLLVRFSILLLIWQTGCKNNDAKSNDKINATTDTPLLSAHIPLDEGKGTVISEVISGTKGELMNMSPETSWVAGPSNNALHFDGENDHVIIPNNPAFDFGDGDFSVSFMMKWLKEDKPFYEHLLTKGDYEASVEGETGKRWEITVVGGKGVCFNIDDDVNRSSLLAPIDAFITGKWVHVVMVRDTKNKQIRAYVDGVPQKSIKPYDRYYDGVDRAGNISNPQNLFIGDASRIDNPFHGELDDIRIYKSALTLDQIVNISKEIGHKPSSSLKTTSTTKSSKKPRVIVTSDGEIDDECSMVRFLLYSNEWDVEGIVTSSSQYHWRGHKWAGDDWITPYLEAYSKVYPNLIKHNKDYPSPEYLKSINFLGNVENKGEMDSITPGSQHIAKVLLDESNNSPIWIQAWGGTNTIARALKTIEEKHPEKMEVVANKLRFFFIWEQDDTYQKYIRPTWGKYNIQTIICDQFWAVAYQWDKIMPSNKINYFRNEWMKSNVLENHGALCSLYEAYKGGDDNEGFRAEDPKTKGDFRSEGDSPSFIYNIPTGLRSLESPAYGGWGGRYTNVRENTWLDPVPESNYKYPEGRWFTRTAWGRNYMRNKYPENPDLMNQYFKPITRWADVLQNDFAARADWCVKSYDEANHAPIVLFDHPLDRGTKVNKTVKLSAKGTHDPDGDELTYNWWQYEEADSYNGSVQIINANKQKASFIVPEDVKKGDSIHIVCEVTDNGSPQITRYQRVILTIKE